MLNNLICWKEKRTKKWEMVKEEDRNAFCYELLLNPSVDKHTIFIIPCNAIFGAIWLWPKNHKSSRVDFYDFFNDFGEKYIAPEVPEHAKAILEEVEAKTSPNTKYGWVSPEGTYFHCEYQGHINLADKICFGMIDTNNSEKYLEDHGWCKIFKPLGERKYTIYVEDKLTDEQLKTLQAMELDNAYGISRYL